jgi:hypothetical protein
MRKIAMMGMTGKFERLCWGACEDGRGVDPGLLLELVLELRRRWARPLGSGLERRDRVVNRPRAEVEEKRDIEKGRRSEKLNSVLVLVLKKKEDTGTG